MSIGISSDQMHLDVD